MSRKERFTESGVSFSDYLGGSRKSVLRIIGNIRAGRAPEVRSKMHAEIVARVADILSVSPDKVTLVLQEVPAEWAMEGGEPLPAPGTEADWMRKHWTDKPRDNASESESSARQPAS